MKYFLILSLSLLLAEEAVSQIDSVEMGIASYYAAKFEGQKTASGEVFSNSKLSAAHKTLPFGTWVKITNLRNDSTIILRINDRLPSYSRRTIDLSQQAAGRLNFKQQGLAKVRIVVLKGR
jgi:rare lipoprotein A